MRGAGGIEHPPLILAHAIGEPHRQRRQQPGGVGIGNLVVDPHGDSCAHRVDGGVRQHQPRIQRRWQHAALEVHAVAKRESRRIGRREVARVGERREPQQQAPPFARARYEPRLAPDEAGDAQPAIARPLAVDDEALDIEEDLAAFARRHIEDAALEQHA